MYGTKRAKLSRTRSYRQPMQRAIVRASRSIIRTGVLRYRRRSDSLANRRVENRTNRASTSGIDVRDTPSPDDTMQMGSLSSSSSISTMQTDEIVDAAAQPAQADPQPSTSAASFAHMIPVAGPSQISTSVKNVTPITKSIQSLTLQPSTSGVNVGDRPDEDAMQIEDQSSSSNSVTYDQSASTTESSSTSSSGGIYDMTSNDFVNDPRAHMSYYEKVIRDNEFCETYYNAIVHNAHLIKDKVVLDVRCGLAMWSMYCCIAGATHVYAIDTSAITELAEDNVKQNRFRDRITVFRGSVADIELPVSKVDVIISSGFGSNLFGHHGLDDMLDARDKWLRPDTGLLLPDRISFHLGTMRFVNEPLEFWKSVYSFKMGRMADLAANEPYSKYFESRDIVNDPVKLVEFNLYTSHKTELRLVDECFNFNCTISATIGAFFTYFKVYFSKALHPLSYCSYEVMSPTKLWKPFIFPLKSADALPVEKRDTLVGTFSMVGYPETGAVDWQFQYCLNNAEGVKRARKTLQLHSS